MDMAQYYHVLMPEGSLNFALATVILALKVFALPRFTLMPAMLCYISASAVETACYLLGWPAAGLSAAVSVLGALAAVESSEWALGMQSDAERSAVRRWCLMLGLVFCAAQFTAGPVAYPRYSELIYEVRLTATVFSFGYLAALLGYCFAGPVGITKYVIHAYVLLVRLMTMGCLLLVRDRSQWFLDDLIGEVINILTLCGWLLLLPSRRVTVKPAV